MRSHLHCPGPVPACPRRAIAAFFVASLVLAGALARPRPVIAAPEQTESVLYQRTYTSNNKIGLTLTNYGFIGTNLTDRTPSMEYPLGSGLDHLVRGGLWVGGKILPSGADTTLAAVTRVSVGCEDGMYNSNPGPATEFTPLNSRILERSRLANNRYFSHDAISEQDLIAEFTDSVPRQGYTYTPLNLNVRWEAYSWSFELASHMVVLHISVTNRGPLLRDVYLGLYTQMVSNNKKLYTGWPPNGASGPRAWFYQTQLDYYDSLHLMTEHFCLSANSCRTDAVCPAWAGLKYLGTRSPNPLAKPHFLWYPWDPNSIPRSTDMGKYALLSDTTAGAPTSTIALGSDSPVELFSLGPFPALQTDSTLTFDFAFLGAASLGDLGTVGAASQPDPLASANVARAGLRSHADFAQLAFDLNYVLPTPPPSPHLRLVPRSNSIEAYWDASPDSTVDSTSLHPDKHDFEGYRVYLGPDDSHLGLVYQADVVDSVAPNSGTAAIRLPEARRFPGDTTAYWYRYTLSGLRDGFKYAVAITSFDKGDARISSLESGLTQNAMIGIPGPDSGQVGEGQISVFPNPYRVEARWDAGALPRDHYLWFVGLPQRARIRIYTLGGDLVKEIDFNGSTYQGAGARGVWDPNSAAALTPPQLSGSMAAWDLITNKDQAAASGLYLYSVEDLATGRRHVGKFAIVKSDIR